MPCFENSMVKFFLIREISHEKKFRFSFVKKRSVVSSFESEKSFPLRKGQIRPKAIKCPFSFNRNFLSISTSPYCLNNKNYRKNSTSIF